MSFTTAAKELNVTPAAISHQIKSLEIYLGVKLFHRRNRSLQLTVAGQSCMPDLRKGFNHLAAAIERIKLNAITDPLVISAPPIFGAKWLIPRISEFSAAHPEIQIRIDPLQKISELEGPETDVAIRFGRGRYPRTTSPSFDETRSFSYLQPRVVKKYTPLALSIRSRVEYVNSF